MGWNPSRKKEAGRSEAERHYRCWWDPVFKSRSYARGGEMEDEAERNFVGVGLLVMDGQEWVGGAHEGGGEDR